MNEPNQPIWAVVPAAGVGNRMGSSTPKQYLPLKQSTVIEHTLERLVSYPHIAGVVVAVAEQDERIKQLDIIEHEKVFQVCGGAERLDSVAAGVHWLKQNHPTGWALVHDAARPCLTHADIDHLLESRTEFPQGAILVAPMVDTIKSVNEDNLIVTTQNRNELYAALTPQLFPVEALDNALQECLRRNLRITDEASAMEAMGVHPGIVVGRRDNIKITFPDDLVLAEFFLDQQSR